MNFELIKSENEINFVNNNKLQHEAEEKEDEDDYYFNMNNSINNMNEIQQTNMTLNSKNHDVRNLFHKIENCLLS